MLLAAAAGILAASPARAQSTSAGEIRGRVVSAADRAPILGATVDVSVAPASSSSAAPAARAISGADGSFRVPGLRPGRYHVHIRSLGFSPWDSASVAVGSTSVDVGTVALVVAPLELQSVAVTEKRSDVQLAPDRNTYVVRDMPAAKGGTALDVLPPYLAWTWTSTTS